jgi:hypothetical protein
MNKDLLHHPCPISSLIVLPPPPIADEPRPKLLGSILSRYVCRPLFASVLLEEFDELPPISTNFTPPRFSPAYLAARHTALSLQDILNGENTPEEWERLLTEVGLDEDRGKSSHVIYRNNVALAKHVELVDPTALTTGDLLHHKLLNNRKSRPRWATDDYELAQRVLGKLAVIARMEWAENKNVSAIADELGMRPSAVQKAITRMGNDVSRLGLRGLDGGCLPRYHFAWECWREENPNMDDSEIARMVVNKWFGSHAVITYAIAVDHWQKGKSMVEIAEEQGMSVDAVQMRLDRLKKAPAVIRKALEETCQQ